MSCYNFIFLAYLCISLDGVAGYHDSDLEVGINCDIRHLRRMVACLIIKFFPRMSHYPTFMSMQINLFFSSIYLNHSQMYFTYQFFHIVFFNLEYCIRLIDVEYT